MENEELFVGDPDIAELHTARETRPIEHVTENTPLIDEADGLHRRSFDLTNNRPKGRRASVSD